MATLTPHDAANPASKASCIMLLTGVNFRPSHRNADGSTAIDF